MVPRNTCRFKIVTCDLAWTTKMMQEKTVPLEANKRIIMKPLIFLEVLMTGGMATHPWGSMTSQMNFVSTNHTKVDQWYFKTALLSLECSACTFWQSAAGSRFAMWSCTWSPPPGPVSAASRPGPRLWPLLRSETRRYSSGDERNLRKFE